MVIRLYLYASKAFTVASVHTTVFIEKVMITITMTALAQPVHGAFRLAFITHLPFRCILGISSGGFLRTVDNTFSRSGKMPGDTVTDYSA